MNPPVRNLVVCLDGTCNEFGAENTNVVRLYQVLRSDPATQVCYYSPGVGTMGHPGAITHLAQKTTEVLGMAFGLGVTQNVIDAYRFLMANYRAGDQLYLFGFSRGALEARALAGLLHRCGLLDPELSALVPYAVRVYQTVDKKGVADRIAAEFQATFARPVRVRFLGLWDTVTSFGNVWSPIFWPNTTNNPGIDSVRHAIALDERRAFFRQNRWAQGDATQRQAVQERWFTGVHCDVGGGYKADESALWTVTLEWMMDEARLCDLQFDDTKLQAIISAGRQSCGDPRGWMSFLHDSMAGLGPVWYLAEFVPRRRYLYTDSGGKAHHEWIWPFWHWVVPWLLGRGKMGRARSVGRARTLRRGDRLHRSVLERFAADANYRPDSLALIKLTLEAAQQFLAGPDEFYEVI